MKLLEALLKFHQLFFGNERIKSLRLLQQQRFLLRQGTEATAEVMETLLFDEKQGNVSPVRLWLKLKKADGTLIYTHTYTLVNLDHVPGKGETIRLKYLPDNLSTILIL
jgi:hypothetical protein